MITRIFSFSDPLNQYLWPPQDLFTRRRQQAHRRRAQWPTQPFTYGDSINPDLIATRSLVSPYDLGNHLGPRRRMVSPYHPDYEEEEDGDGRDGDEPTSFGSQSDSGQIANGHITDPDQSDDDDDEPLSKLVARRQNVLETRYPSDERRSESVRERSSELVPLPSRPAPLLRRGSEGYEVNSSPWGTYDGHTHQRAGYVEEWADEEGSEGSDGP